MTEKIAVFAPIPSASVAMATRLNPGDFQSWRKAKRRSLIWIYVRRATSFRVKSNNGIDGAGPARGQPAGNERDEDQRRRKKDKRDWIARANSVKERRDQSR